MSVFYYIPEEEANRLQQMPDDELRDYIKSLRYDDFWPIESTFRGIKDEFYKPIRPYRFLEREAEELKATVSYDDETNEFIKKHTEEYDKWNDKYNIISRTINAKKENCNHEWEKTGCCGYDRSNDIYTCQLCGMKKVR